MFSATRGLQFGVDHYNRIALVFSATRGLQVSKQNGEQTFQVFSAMRGLQVFGVKTHNRVTVFSGTRGLQNHASASWPPAIVFSATRGLQVQSWFFYLRSGVFSATRGLQSKSEVPIVGVWVFSATRGIAGWPLGYRPVTVGVLRHAGISNIAGGLRALRYLVPLQTGITSNTNARCGREDSHIVPFKSFLLNRRFHTIYCRYPSSHICFHVDTGSADISMAKYLLHGR